MLLASFSIVFALIFGTIAYRSVPYGWTLTRLGWTVLRVKADKPNVTQNVEARNLLTDGYRFFFAGLGWLITGIVAALLTIFAVLVIPYILSLP
ncbi:MAG: hypothetical protein Q9P01_18690, partial [Anaerolineae bacterium]|nr:hypothetical protein [Anaerolineae bacterium]MDQ7036782.1 hypothetical protein [Anaerolineae bacterium]